MLPGDLTKYRGVEFLNVNFTEIIFVNFKLNNDQRKINYHNIFSYESKVRDFDYNSKHNQIINHSFCYSQILHNYFTHTHTPHWSSRGNQYTGIKLTSSM